MSIWLTEKGGKFETWAGVARKMPGRNFWEGGKQTLASRETENDNNKETKDKKEFGAKKGPC